MFLKTARWVTDKYILVMLGLFPLYTGFGPHAYSSITASKFHFFLYTTLAWLAAVLVLLILAALRREPMRPAVRPAHLAMGLFLALGGLSAAFSEYGGECLMGAGRYDGYLMTALYCAAFFGVSLLSSPRPGHAWAMGISVTLCCGVALLQLLGFDPFSFYPEGMNYYDKFEGMSAAFLGTIGNTGILAAYLTLAAPLLIVFAVLSPRRWDSLLLLPGAFAVAILLLCDVDAGLLALAGCLLVTVPMVLPAPRTARRAAAVSGGLTLAGLLGLYFWPGRSGTLWEISQVLHGRMADEFGSHRGQIWKQCLALFREKPWLGGGPGTVTKRLDIRWSRYIESLGTERTVHVDNAHNVFLGYLVNIGLPGTLAYLAAFFLSMVTWLRRRTDGALYPALGSALLCCMIQEFFGLGIVLTTPMLFIVWGLLESSEPPPETEPAEDSEDEGNKEKTEAPAQ